MNIHDTIAAPATGDITSALGIIRVSGTDAVEITSKIFVPYDKKDFAKSAKANTLYYGNIVDFRGSETVSNLNKANPDNPSTSSDTKSQKSNIIIDEVIVSIFLSPHSFTGEDTVEITHHGSTYIQQEILSLLLLCGARLADKGEFSMRAFLNGKINLSQAEAVADLIQSDNRCSHDIAINQLRGGYNNELKALREQFMKIASLLELEIDFSAEQEVFVDRNDLYTLLEQTNTKLEQLINSFRQGNAFKNGIPVAIAGKPNSGKSTFMNAVLNDDRSIVSSIEGTTRDTIEETITVNGLKIRFIDTAGIRESNDEIEKEGIKRSFEAVKKSQKVIYLIDASQDDLQSVDYQLKFLQQEINSANSDMISSNGNDNNTEGNINNSTVNDNLIGKDIILVVNKDDISSIPFKDRKELLNKGALFISAKQKKGIDKVLNAITNEFNTDNISSNVFVSNIRHYNALQKSSISTSLALLCLTNGESADLISYNIRKATEDIGAITGEITSEDILTNIFSNFCIGK